MTEGRLIGSTWPPSSLSAVGQNQRTRKRRADSAPRADPCSSGRSPQLARQRRVRLMRSRDQPCTGSLRQCHQLPISGLVCDSIVLPRTDPHPARSIYLIERHLDALRIAGTLELVRNDLSINHRRVNVILRSAKAMLNIGETARPRKIRRGLRPCTPRRHAADRPRARSRRRVACVSRGPLLTTACGQSRTRCWSCGRTSRLPTGPAWP